MAPERYCVPELANFSFSRLYDSLEERFGFSFARGVVWWTAL
jgi:hypothetical protein